MELKKASISILDQVSDFLGQLMPEDYSIFIESLNASIGQHVRHIAEFYICLFDGLTTNEVNYDKRKRDKRIEQDKNFALETISDIRQKVIQTDNNPDLNLKLKYGEISDSELTINTNYERELAYNIEHTIHHLAIIKTVFDEICEYVKVPENFGVASSTLRFKNTT